MNKARKQKLTVIIFILTGVSIAIAFTLYALRQNINLFYTPTQVISGKAPINHPFRVGGMVKKGSLTRDKESLLVEFVISDFNKEIKLAYTGILPDLFREGQGIVAHGKLDTNGNFQADQVLAKHDENYMPPEIRDTLKVSKGKDAS